MVDFPKNDTFAFIIGGGGMRIAYGVGAAEAIIHKLKFTNPDILMGCSGGELAAKFWASGKHEIFKNAYKNDHYSTKKLLDTRRFGNILNIDHLTGNILTNLDRLDTEAVNNSPIDVYTPVVEKYGGVRYFSNREGFEVLDIMRASMSVPLLTGLNPWVPIDGKMYCDSAFTADPTNHLEKAVELGATKILIIGQGDKENGEQSNMEKVGKAMYKTWHKRWGNGQTQEMKDAVTRAETYRVPDYVEVFTLQPEDLDINFADNNQESLAGAKAQGFRETDANEALRRFLIIPNPHTKVQLAINNSDKIDRWGQEIQRHIPRDSNRLEYVR